jgi:protein SCO1/2
MAQAGAMTTRRLLAMLIAAIVGTVAFVKTSPRGYEVTGVVMEPPRGGYVSVAHDDIPGLMPAMTMPFALGSNVPALTPGDRVRFTLRVGNEASWIEDVERLGRDETRQLEAVAPVPASTSRLRVGDLLPDFALTTEAGRPLTRADLTGQVTAVTFVFTRCPVPEFCPRLARHFLDVQREAARDPALRDVRLLSVTIDPSFDTPAVLKAYADAIDADPARWTFATGEPTEVERLTRAFSVHTERNGVFIDHTLATAVIDADGRVAAILRGNGWRTAELLDALREAAVHGRS